MRLATRYRPGLFETQMTSQHHEAVHPSEKSEFLNNTIHYSIKDYHKIAIINTVLSLAIPQPPFGHCERSNGQIMSECIYEIMDFPKYH